MAGGRTVYLNGDFVPAQDAMVSVFDRGFLFGDGVYEIIPVRSGRILLLQRHLERLRASLAGADMNCRVSDGEWLHILQRLQQQHGYQQCSMYVQVTRGVDPRRAHVAEPEQPTVFAACLEIDGKHLERLWQGVKVATAEDIRWQWCHIKTTCLLANVLLRRQAARSDCHEMLLVRDGMLVEGAASNVFVVDEEGEVRTPPLSQSMLPGITRQLALEALASAGMPCRESEIEAASLPRAREVWLSSSSGGLVPVVAVDDMQIADGSPGPLWQRASRHLAQAELDASAS